MTDALDKIPVNKDSSAIEIEIPPALRVVYRKIVNQQPLEAIDATNFITLLALKNAKNLTYEYEGLNHERLQGGNLLLFYLTLGKANAIAQDSRFERALKNFFATIEPKDFIDKNPSLIEEYSKASSKRYPNFDPEKIIKDGLLKIYTHPECNIVSAASVFNAIEQIFKNENLYNGKYHAFKKLFTERCRESFIIFNYAIKYSDEDLLLHKSYRHFFQKHFSFIIQKVASFSALPNQGTGMIDIFIPREFSRKIPNPKDENIYSAITQIYNLLRDPALNIELLKEVSESIKERQGSNQYKQIPLEDFALLGQGKMFFPLLPKEDYSTFVKGKKNGLLQNICAEIIKDYNLEVGSLFVGGAPAEVADNSIRGGKIFRDSPLSGIGLTHSKNSHLLQITMICLAINKKHVQLSGCTLQDVLTAMVEMKGEEHDGTLWQNLLDTFNVAYHSPFIFNSWLMAQNEKLPELSGYLRLVFFRSMEKILAARPDLTQEEILLSQFLQNGVFEDLLGIDVKQYYQEKGETSKDVAHDSYYIRASRGERVLQEQDDLAFLSAPQKIAASNSSSEASADRAVENFAEATAASSHLFTPPPAAISSAAGHQIKGSSSKSKTCTIL